MNPSRIEGKTLVFSFKAGTRLNRNQVPKPDGAHTFSSNQGNAEATRKECWKGHSSP
jgi:hypothetical protein